MPMAWSAFVPYCIDTVSVDMASVVIVMAALAMARSVVVSALSQRGCPQEGPQADPGAVDT